MPKNPWIELPLCGLAVFGAVIVLFGRLYVKQKTTKDGVVKEAPRGIGVRMIQLLTLIIILPLVGILALEGALSAGEAGTIIASIAGYGLASISSEEKS
jgi:hypothetical protein